MPRYGIQIVTPATDLAVSVADAKRHLRILGRDALNAEIEDLIKSATEVVEQDSGISLVPKTYMMVLDQFPYYVANRILPFDYQNSAIVFPRDPVTSITSFNYVDTDGNVVPYTTYQLSNKQKPSRVRSERGQFWPYSDIFTVDAVQITFVAGFTDANRPYVGKRAILNMLAHMYENREATAEKPLSDVLYNYKKLIPKLKVAGYVG